MKILITTSSFGKADISPLEYLKERVYEVVLNPYRRKLTEEEVSTLLSATKAIGMIAGLEPLTKKVLEQAPNLKVIVRCGIGMDKVDLKTAERLGIRVYNTPDGPTSAVAELTLGLILAVLRRISEADRNIRGGNWNPLMGKLLAKQTVGIIGCGRIGSKVGELLNAFGTTVIGCDLHLQDSNGIELVDFERLLSSSDIITLHVPYMKENHHLINSETIKKMKKGAILINTARGGIVDENAIYKAIKNGHLTGAGFDTFEKEPYKGSLMGLPTVVMTSHMGSYAQESRIQMEWDAVKKLIQGLKEEKD